MIRYISLFSGIEAASCAWEPLGWEPVAFSEIEPFPCAVLAERFPDVPNLGDITEIDWKEVLEKYGEVDLIVGGSPCQSFSVAGKCEGLSGESRLMFEYIRAVQEVRPRWFVWENVPGALTSEGGAAFGQLLREMDGLGYGVAWRVLDSRFFGVPQRRRRVFAVGRLGDIEGPCQVLFEPEMLRWDAPSGNKRWEELSAHARGRAGREASVGLPWSAAGKASGYGIVDGLSPTLRATRCGEPAVCVQGTIANGKRMGQNGLGASEGACYTLDTMDVHGVCYERQGEAMNPWDYQSFRVFPPDGTSPTLAAGERSGNITPAICYAIPENAMGRPNSGTNGPMFYEELCPTERCGKAHAVCYAQNQRYEVRQSGDGTTCGAIPASQSGKQFDFVCLPTTQYGEDMAGTLLARNDGSPCDNKGPNVVCIADDNAHAAVDEDVCGTLKVGGGAPCVVFPRTARAGSGRSAQETSRESGASSSKRGR